MNYRLLFLDPSMRILGRVLPGVAALVALQVGVLNRVILGPEQGLVSHPEIITHPVAQLVFRLVIPIPLFCALIYAVSRSCFRGTYSEYELSLPETGRTLLAYRVLARLILVLAPLVVTLVIALWITESQLGERIIKICGLNLGSGLLLCIFVHIHQSRKGGFWMSTAVALSLGLVFAGIFVESPWYGIALLGLALAAGLVLYGSRNAPHYLFREEGKAVAAVDHEVLTPRQALRMTILRLTVLNRSSMGMAFTVIFFMALYGIQPGNMLMKYVMPFFFAIALSSVSTMGLRKLDHLPLSRHRLFPFIILPGLCCLWLGLLVTDLIPYRVAPHGGPAVELDFMDVSLPVAT